MAWWEVDFFPQSQCPHFPAHFQLLSLSRACSDQGLICGKQSPFGTPPTNPTKVSDAGDEPAAFLAHLLQSHHQDQGALLLLSRGIRYSPYGPDDMFGGLSLQCSSHGSTASVCGGPPGFKTSSQLGSSWPWLWSSSWGLYRSAKVGIIRTCQPLHVHTPSHCLWMCAQPDISQFYTFLMYCYYLFGYARS